MKTFSQRSVFLVLAGIAIFSSNAARGEHRFEILSRGPIHEAFAETIIYDPEPGLIIYERPPAPIEELSPVSRPRGDNVAWIPGYWAWDDSQDEFVWVSGVWRSLPPGRVWVPGYWVSANEGYQWVPGYWANAQYDEIEYLPEPPESAESGPSGDPPSPDYVWIPGVWVWQGSRYAWRPGHWAASRPDWEWTPAHYVWTPSGYVYVDGYWDYDIDRRGVLFAPVRFEREVYRRERLRYEPNAVVNLSQFVDSLFFRPRYSHYYFGDYYSPAWERKGFVRAHDYHRRHRAYDPIYAHRQWRNRNDRNWNRDLDRRYSERRNDARRRPPHTWNRGQSVQPVRDNDLTSTLISGLDQLINRKESPLGFSRVNDGERRSHSGRLQEITRAQSERQQLEARRAGEPAARKQQSPIRLKLPKSNIIGKLPGQLGNAAPPKPLTGPKLDPRVTPKARAAAPQPRPEAKKAKK